MTTQAQTTIDVECTRCGGQRWIPMPYIALDAKGRPIGSPSDLREPDGDVCLLCRFTPAEEWAARQVGRQARAKQMLETRRTNASTPSPDLPGGAQTPEEGS